MGQLERADAISGSGAENLPRWGAYILACAKFKLLSPSRSYPVNCFLTESGLYSAWEVRWAVMISSPKG